MYLPSDVEPHSRLPDTGCPFASTDHRQSAAALEGYAFIDSLDKFSDRQTSETHYVRSCPMRIIPRSSASTSRCFSSFATTR